MTELKTYYEILEVSELASTETIRAAYRSLSKRFHPDAKTGDAEKFRMIGEAHECLVDGGKRKAYDTELQRSRAPKADAPKATRAKKAPRAREAQATPEVSPFDPSKGVEALFMLGNVVMQEFGVSPAVQTVVFQLQPDLQRIAVEGLKRMVGA